MKLGNRGSGAGVRSLAVFGALFFVGLPFAYLEGAKRGYPVLHVGANAGGFMLLFLTWDWFLSEVERNDGVLKNTN